MTQQEFFNRYHYKTSTDKLGGGSFGKVYKAYDTVLDKYIAIKVAEQIEVQGKTFSLVDEFKALENLPDHINVAKYEHVYTFESPQGVYDYALMQYYENGNLQDYVRNSKITDVQKHEILLQILNALKFLHENGIVHRDLNPRNILIVQSGDGDCVPKLFDFGISNNFRNSGCFVSQHC